MANKRICVQIDFNGPDPIVGLDPYYDKRTSLENLVKLLRGINQGSQFRPSSVIVQKNVSSATGTVTCAAVAVNDEVNVVGLDFVAKHLRSSGTVTPGTAGNVPQAGDTLTINGVVFTAVNGAVVLGAATFDISGNGQAQCDSITAQVNAYASPALSGIVGAKNSATVVTFYSVALGVGGDAITLATSNNTRLAKSGTTLANGAAPAIYEFDQVGTNAETAEDIVRAVEAAHTSSYLTVDAASNVVTFTAVPPGYAGNTFAFDSSNHTRLAVSGSGFLENGNMNNPIVWNF